ncbi:MAG: 3-phosphoshikimate 1-carboxyvinyltransferase, partial [Bacteroidota bacterium]
IKETDRVEALWHELTRLGALVEIQEGDVLQLTAGPLHPPVEPIRTYEDHRMAMAFAPMCLAVGSLRLAHPEVVVKSYPEFWEHLLAVGFRKEEA